MSIICVVLDLMHDSSNWLCESYEDYINDIIVANRVTYRLCWLYICVSRMIWYMWSTFVSCLCRFVSLTSYMHNENMNSWIRMLKPLSLVCINYMWPTKLFKSLFMLIRQPSYKVMISFKCDSRNGILLVWMASWKGIKLSLRKSLSYPLDDCKATLGDLFVKVNVFGLWTRYGTS